MIRAIICGGRDFGMLPSEHRVMREAMHSIYMEYRWPGLENKFWSFAEGGARGADRLGRTWALDVGHDVVTYHANWKKHGRKAGPIRNQRMLEDFQPHLVIAFPGGPGTADMILRAIERPITVVQVLVDGSTFRLEVRRGPERRTASRSPEPQCCHPGDLPDGSGRTPQGEGRTEGSEP